MVYIAEGGRGNNRRAILSVDRKSMEEILGLKSNLGYLYDKGGPAGAVMALNELRGKAITEVTSAVWGEMRYEPVKGANGKPVKTGIKRRHIANRIFSQRANKNHPSFSITMYTKPMPAISIGETNVRDSPGLSRIKGKYVSAKTPGKRAKNQTPRPSGVKVGGVFLPYTFVNQVSRNKTVQVMMRMHTKTWKKGHSGWNLPPGSKQTHARERYIVVTFDMHPVFLRLGPRNIQNVIARDGAKAMQRGVLQSARKILVSNTRKLS